MSPRSPGPAATNATTKAPKPGKPPVRIFVSYSHANAAARDKLQVHLAQLMRDGVETWFDGRMHAGDKLDTQISAELKASHIFVALMSPEYIASPWCQLEYRRAMGRRSRGSMRIVVVVRPCDWKATGASDLKVLPRNGRPVSGWRTADDAFNDVTQGIRGAVRAVRAAMTEAAKAKTSVSVRRPALAKKAAATAQPRIAGPARAQPGKKAVTAKRTGPKRAGV